MSNPTLECKISDKTKMFKNKLQISNSGFLLIDPSSIRFIEDMCSLKKIPNIVELIIKKDSLILKNISNFQNYLYPKILKKETQLLFKNFNFEYIPVSIKDFFLIDENLYYIKMINLNGFLKVNSTKDVIEDNEQSFLNDSWVYNKMGSTRNLKCFMNCKEDDHEYNLFEICNCDKLIHLKCFQKIFLDKTKVEHFENYFKMTVQDFKCFDCGKRYESFSIWKKKVKCFLNLPNLNNDDNIIMLVELNQYNLDNNIFVGYFLRANTKFKKYRFQNKLKYISTLTSFSFKAVNKKSKIYKEKSYLIDYSHLKQNIFFINDFEITFKKNNKKNIFHSLRNLKSSLFNKTKFSIKSINSFADFDEFEKNEHNNKMLSISQTNFD